jgi:hypothetical protein
LNLRDLRSATEKSSHPQLYDLALRLRSVNDSTVGAGDEAIYPYWLNEVRTATQLVPLIKQFLGAEATARNRCTTRAFVDL